MTHRIHTESLRPSHCERQPGIPKLLRIGHGKGSGIPWLIPFPLDSGLWLEPQSDNEQAALELAEDWALQLLLQAPIGQVEFHVHDTGLDTALPTLERLATLAKSRGITQQVHFITDVQTLQTQLEQWQAEARQRKSQLLQTGHTSWVDLLKVESGQPLRVLLLTSLEDLADSDRLQKLLPGLVQYGARLGLCIWLVGCPQELSSHRNEHDRQRWAEWFEQRMEAAVLHFGLAGSGIELPEAWREHPAVRIYREFGILQADGLIAAQRESALQRSLEFAVEAQDPDLPDYWSVPIGQFQGEDFLFRVGPRSGSLHTLLAGTTNTGKTSLLNLLITRTCEAVSPDEVQFLLFDLKQGVSFGLFDGVAHVARLYLHATDFEPVLQTLRDLKAETQTRAARFQEVAPKGVVPDIVAYNRLMRQRGQPTMPVLVVVIDEVQKLFTEAPLLKAAEVKRLVDEVAREGRAYGMSFLLSSQSFIGVDLPVGAKKQFRQRLAFSLADEIDCGQVLDQGNTLPLRLPKHHLLVNTDFGRTQSNKVVRVDYVGPDEIHHRLQAVRERYAARPAAGMAVAAVPATPAPLARALDSGNAVVSRRPSFMPPPLPPMPPAEEES